VDSFEGEGGVYRYLRQEAEQAGYDEKVLKRMLKAGAFLDGITDRALTVDDVRCGYAHIELLERLHQLAAPEAKRLLEEVLSNGITLKNLRQAVVQSTANGGQAQITARSKARTYVAEHQRITTELVQRMGTTFFGSPNGEFILVKSFLSLRQFILINNKTKPVAIIPRVGDSSIKEWEAAEEILKLAASVKGRLYRVWIVLPHDSPIAGYLFAYAHREKALNTWLFIATVNEDRKGLSLYSDASTLLTLDLDGSGGGDWAGYSLKDGRGMYGALPIRNAPAE
jgi:hypothetical protein